MSIIFITGGSRGIGYQLVKQYASIRGNTVIATTRNIEKSVPLTDLAKDLGNIKVLALEISSQESIDALEKSLPEAIPNGIDIFIANAGVGESLVGVLDTPREVYQQHHETNVLGTIFVTKIVYPYLLKKQTRKIIYISSTVGQITDFFSDVPFAAYGQSKAALNYTSKALSSELEPEGFTVVPINPGAVATDLVKNNIAGLPEEVRNYILGNSLTPEFSAEAIIKVVDGLTKDYSGTFFDYNGKELTY